VISVGNLAVGGTGKTPVAAWVAQRLAAAGVPTHLLAGLHGADEALLHARWSPSVPVLVDRNRARAAARAHAEGARAVVLDDGFQHFAVARDLDIVLLAAEDRFPGPVLPRGPYRERPEALARADAVVVTRRTATCEAALALAERARRLAPEALSAGLRLAPGGLQPLSVWAEPARADADGAELRRVAAPALAVCALGRPDAFGEAVAEQVGGPVELMAFADHHAYTLVEVDRVSALAEGRPIVVSAKDAVKLAPYAARLGAAWVLTEELCWDWGEETLARRIDALMAEAVGP
jgi:tetraacyldisaccharide 4'-kinase